MGVSIDEAQQTALACVCAALEAQGRPVCECYTTIGEPMAVVCCECTEGTTGEVSIRLVRFYDVDESMEQIPRVRPCRGGSTAAEFILTLYRCYPTIQEDGSIPEYEDQSERASEMNHDASIIWNALACCTDLRVNLQELAVDTSPLGGCSELTLLFSVEASARAGLLPAEGLATSP